MYADTDYQDRPAWRVICRTINDEGLLVESIMTWHEAPVVAKQYAEAQTVGLRYKIKRKRTKEEILGTIWLISETLRFTRLPGDIVLERETSLF